ncbi:hypothetical protein CSKR_108299 [Clonorchis sinensis]|uniref:Uncharacterized protein n=1 Tax=Clonorchis sinensis TaxID=79923 RepID=A0A3R7EWF8_CLOSI|nr:hypothetical protein CSKR_108299 [Clonorchis sinensis]
MSLRFPHTVRYERPLPGLNSPFITGLITVTLANSISERCWNPSFGCIQYHMKSSQDYLRQVDESGTPIAPLKREHFHALSDVKIQMRPTCAGGVVVIRLSGLSDVQSSKPGTANDIHCCTVICECHGCTRAGILPGRPHLDGRMIRVLNQSLWLKSLTVRQRCWAGNASTLPFLRNTSPHMFQPPTWRARRQRDVDFSLVLLRLSPDLTFRQGLLFSSLEPEPLHSMTTKNNELMRDCLTET